jgi:hypothetical protein
MRCHHPTSHLHMRHISRMSQLLHAYAAPVDLGDADVGAFPVQIDVIDCLYTTAYTSCEPNQLSPNIFEIKAVDVSYVIVVN